MREGFHLGFFLGSDFCAVDVELDILCQFFGSRSRCRLFHYCGCGLFYYLYLRLFYHFFYHRGRSRSHGSFHHGLGYHYDGGFYLALLKAKLVGEAYHGCELPVAAAVLLRVEAVVEVVGAHFEVHAEVLAYVTLEHKAGAEVVNEAVVFPSQGHVGVAALLEGVEVVIVPGIAQTETAEEDDVEEMALVLAAEHVGEVKHQVEVAGGIVVVVALVVGREIAFVLPSVGVETHTDRGGDESTGREGTDGSDEFLGRVVGECGLTTALYADKAVGIGMVVFLALLSVETCSGQGQHEGGY